MEELQENLNKEEIIELFEVLVKAEDCVEQGKTVREWKSRFDFLTKEEELEQRKAFEGSDEEGEFEFVVHPIDARWKELSNIFKDKVAAHKKQIAEQEKENLTIKEALLEKLKSLVEEDMQNVGAAFTVFYEIRDKWNETGQVNKSKFKELQYDYSKYRDLFYYNVGIHDQLKNYDFKKNAEQKEEIVAELKEALKVDSIRKMEKTVKELQAKWDEIGPTTNEAWETLKNEYWDTVNAIYEKIKTHYKAIRETQAKVLEEKNGLITRLEELIESAGTKSNPGHWAKMNDTLNGLHAEWKAAGFVGKGKEEALWTKFKELSDQLRDAKNNFFDELKKSNSKVVDAKNALIEKAESLKESKEWKRTTEELIQLQKRWKSAGQAQYKIDQKLWEQFRAACDTFFTAKKEYFDTLDDRQADNFKKKEELATQIAGSKTKETLIESIGAWQAVGYVPKKQKAKSDANFDKAVSAAGKALKIDKEALDLLQFNAKVAAIKADENADQKLKAEKDFIHTQMDKVKEELHRFEENMAFFGPSKGAQKLKEIVEKKMSVAEEQLENWKEKLKLLRE